MARRAQGWKLHPRGKVLWVRFTHEGERVERSTGERDAGPASARAAEIYAGWVSGRRHAGVGRVRVSDRAPVDELAAEWLVSLANTHSDGTRGMYEVHMRATLGPFFKTIDRVTTRSIGDFQRTRLGQVLRKTVRKELHSLRFFLGWCVEQEHLEEVPGFPTMPKGALGIRSGKRKAKAVEVTPEQVATFLLALPERSDGRRAKKGEPRRDAFAVRAYAVVAWETALRPATIGKLSVPEHYQKGAAHMTITADIDKVRFGRAVPLTPGARAVLDEACPEKGLLFGRHDARRYFKAAALAAKMPLGFSPYDLRHARTTELIERTGNLLGVAYLVGHKQVTTTNAYAKPTQRAAERALASAGLWDNSGTHGAAAAAGGAASAGPVAQKPKGPATSQVAEPVGASGFEPPTPRPPEQRWARFPRSPRRGHARKQAEDRGSVLGIGTMSQNDDAVSELTSLAVHLDVEAALWDALDEDMALAGGRS
jgi:integrase